MSELPKDQPAAGIELGTIYYTLFRHKWKIIVCSLAGFAGAVALFKLRPPPYQSEAGVLVSWVVQDNGAAGVLSDDGTVVKSTDTRGETILNDEIQILNSGDLARQVARTVGPERIIDVAALQPDQQASANEIAAATIRNGLTVASQTNSGVIRITFAHNDPTIVQPVLQNLITSYIQRSNQVHGPNLEVAQGMRQIADDLQEKLQTTEGELQGLLKELGINSLAEFKESNLAEKTELQTQLRDVKVDLAERTARLNRYRNQSGTNEAGTSAGIDAPKPSAEVTAAYRRLAERLARLQESEIQLLMQYSPQSSLVTANQQDQEAAAAEMHQMEQEHPALLAAANSVNPASGGNAVTYDPVAEEAAIEGLQARQAALQTELENAVALSNRVGEVEQQIAGLERERTIQSQNYIDFSAQLDRSQLARTFGSNSVSKITTIESPTVPKRVWSKELKLIAGVGLGGIALGLGWAFAIELYLDRSLRRASDIEKGLRLPLFLSMPRFKAAALKGSGGSLRLAAPGKPSGEGADSGKATETSDAPGPLSPFFETLSDRLQRFFESADIRHKPKLVAVTGVGKKTGVTTVASELARAISATGDANVLMVDMTTGQGSVQHLHKGKTVSLEQMLDTREPAQAGERLFVVDESISETRLSRNLPQRFNQLVPKLKSSDFDYIIFDMPAVNQISITPRLSSFMDMVLMVVESEKTSRDSAARAAALLEQSNARVGVVLNKSKSYVPKRLYDDQELLLEG